ncbi:Protein KASH5 [Labeo rohita]|uniref:Protein KASH5 n=1 Tax=Labeo rohita TaxID=84645 RepID=A0ABQ8MAH0_LABRO|nr:Protein KASH5 [Labeo rohita]
MNSTEPQAMEKEDEEEMVIYANADEIFNEDRRTGVEDSDTDTDSLCLSFLGSVRSRMYGGAAVCVLLLCVLVTVIIVQRVQLHYCQTVTKNFGDEREQFQNMSTDLEKERNQLQKEKTDLINERDQLQKEKTDFINERDQLQKEKTDLINERDQEIKIANLMEELKLPKMTEGPLKLHQVGWEASVHSHFQISPETVQVWALAGPFKKIYRVVP